MQKAFTSDKIVIFADTREMSTKVTAILEKSCDLRQKQLDVADYLLSERVAAERKTVADFLQSIIDRRLFTQLTNMKENFPNSILIIEGKTLMDNDRNIHPNAIRGALASIAVDYEIPIIWTENQLETAEILLTIAKREQREKGKSVAIRGKRRRLTLKQQQEFIVTGIPKVNTVLAQRLLDEFGTPEKVFTASEEELRKIKGIGKKMSKNIKEILGKNIRK